MDKHQIVSGSLIQPLEGKQYIKARIINPKTGELYQVLLYINNLPAPQPVENKAKEVYGHTIALINGQYGGWKPADEISKSTAFRKDAPQFFFPDKKQENTGVTPAAPATVKTPNTTDVPF